MKSYRLKYVKPKIPKQPLGRISVQFQGEEPLIGTVQGKPASDIEERFYRSCVTYKIPNEFQKEIEVATSLPGQGKQVDYVLRGRQYVNVHGEIGHSSGSDKARDRIRDVLINDELRKQGLPPIETVYWWELSNQKQADETVRSRFA